MVPFPRPSRGSRVLPSVLALALSGGALLLGATPAAAAPPLSPIQITVNGKAGTVVTVAVDTTTPVTFVCVPAYGYSATAATVSWVGVSVDATENQPTLMSIAPQESNEEPDEEPPGSAVTTSWIAAVQPTPGLTGMTVTCLYPAAAPVQAGSANQEVTTEKRGASARFTNDTVPAEVRAGSTLMRAVQVSASPGESARERIPTGTVQFYLGQTPVGVPVSLSEAGLAVGSIPVPTAVGPYELTFSYSGDAAFSELTSAGRQEFAAVSHERTAIETTTTLTQPVATPLTLKAVVVSTGHHPSDVVVVTRGDATLGSGDVQEDGTVSVPVGVLAIGTHTLTLSYAGNSYYLPSTATVTVTVAGEPARSTDKPNIGVALDTPTPAVLVGGSVTLLADDFDPGETVAFFLHSDPVYLGTVVADAQGRARLVVTLPAGVPTGPHTAIATGGTSGRWATTAITVSAPAVVTPPAVVPEAPVAPVAAVPVKAVAQPTTLATGPATLAATGAQPTGVATGALALMLAGMALVAWVRRSPATEPDQD